MHSGRSVRISIKLSSKYMNEFDRELIDSSPVLAFLVVNRTRSIMNLFNKQPTLGKDVFVAPNAIIVGDVKLGNQSSVFYGSVLRGELLDANPTTCRLFY